MRLLCSPASSAGRGGIVVLLAMLPLMINPQPAAAAGLPLLSTSIPAGPDFATGFVPIETPHAAGDLFYFFAPPRNGDATAPLIMWLQGGPGASSIEDGLLREMGPLFLNVTAPGTEPALQNRTVGAWNDAFALLFVDQPVGTGYSTGVRFPQNETHVAEGLAAFLQGFYGTGLWPAANRLFVAGESFGGHFVPALAHRLLEDEARPDRGPLSDRHRVRLAGIAIGDGLTDPAAQVRTKPAQAYAFGLVDERGRDEAQAHADAAAARCAAGDLLGALRARELMEQTVVNASRINPYDVRRFGPYDKTALNRFLNSTAGKRALGVPPDVVFGTDPRVHASLEDDIMRGYETLLPALIDALPGGVLLYQGQFDWKDGYTSNSAWIPAIAWDGAAAFERAERRVWTAGPGERPAGWIKGPVRGPSGGGPLAQAVVAGAGHLVPMDQPEAAQALIERFVRGWPEAGGGGGGADSKDTL
jgi:vitellogenic carboxypeptidase-like protein